MQAAIVHHIAFPITPDQLNTIEPLKTQLREEPGSKVLRKAYIKLINDLADTGIDYFFLKSLKDAGVGYLKIKTAEVGLQTLKTGLLPILRGFVNGLSDTQLLSILDFMEGILLRTEA